MYAAALMLAVSGSAVHALTYLLFAMLFILSAGALAPLGVLCCFLSAGVILAASVGVTERVVSGAASLRRLGLAFICTLLCAVGLVPGYDIPEYPADAILSADWPVTRGLRPFFSSRAQPVSMLYSAYSGLSRFYLEQMLLLLASFSLGLVLVGSAANRRSLKGAMALILPLSIAAAMAMPLYSFPEYAQRFAPLSLLTAFVPGFSGQTLPWLSFAILLPLAFIHFAGGASRKQLAVIFLLSAIVLSSNRLSELYSSPCPYQRVYFEKR